jgi:zinc transporter ZupT
MLLAASIAALVIGPALFQISRAGQRAVGFLEGFTFITIAGLLCFSILPQGIIGGGTVAWGFALLGLVFPVGLERLFHHLARQVHLVILLVGMAGLAVHAALDGAALSMADLGGSEELRDWMYPGDHNSADDLALAVVLHRFPLGLAVWYLLAPALGAVAAVAVLGVLTVGTMLGYFLAPDFALAAHSTGIAWFQAFVAGSILHVIIYEPGHHKHPVTERSPNLEKWPDRIGLVCGLVLLYVYL